MYNYAGRPLAKAPGTSPDSTLDENHQRISLVIETELHHFDISRQEVFRWCMRYNTRRRHSWCNFLAPNDFEALTSATLTQAA